MTKQKEAILIEKDIRAKFKITKSELYGTERTVRIVVARHRLWRILHTELGYSFPKLGKMYNRDHSTILRAVHKQIK